MLVKLAYLYVQPEILISKYHVGQLLNCPSSLYMYLYTSLHMFVIGFRSFVKLESKLMYLNQEKVFNSYSWYRFFFFFYPG